MGLSEQAGARVVGTTSLGGDVPDRGSKAKHRLVGHEVDPFIGGRGEE
mgnify:CR=1 FL=1|jgi:hypothetical protein